MESATISSAFHEQESDLLVAVRELNSLVGLKSVKTEIRRIINLAKVDAMRRSRGLQTANMSFHMVFSGNPGTGKTTVARLLGRIFKGLGLLSKGHLVEVDRSSLCADYVGQTATKTKKVIQSALGGVLFIDEAYSLNARTSSGTQDYGREAVSTLLKEMEDHRDDLIVIVAGYPDLMDDFISMNPGLESRFRFKIKFEDYSSEEMAMIFWSFCKRNGFGITKEAYSRIQGIFVSYTPDKGQMFSNARLARNLFENAVLNQAQRLSGIENPSDCDLTVIVREDLIA